MQRIILTLLVLVVTVGSSWGANRLAGGNMLGRTLYWESDGFSPDTLGWDEIEKAVIGVSASGKKTARQACDTLEKQSKVVVRVKDPSALSMAILADLGYRPLCLTQWVVTTDAKIKITAPGFENDYRQRRMVSEMLWEAVSKADIVKPTKMNPDFAVSLDFDSSGRAEFSGREVVFVKSVGMTGASGSFTLMLNGAVLPQNGQLESEDVSVKRTIRAVYIVLDKTVKPSAVISQLEKTMDKLGLDLSYKPPELVPVKCR